MTTTRSAAVFWILVAALAVLALVYATPRGRRAVREASRGVRLARQLTGLSPQPVLTIRIWGGTPRRTVGVELYKSGRLLVLGDASADQQLSPDTAEAIVRLGTAARGDFNSRDCNTGPERPNTDLYVLIDGQWQGSVCRGAASAWPRGAETRRLFEELGRQLPGGMKLLDRF